MLTNLLAAATLAALSVAMPVTDSNKTPLLPREDQTPENIPLPPAGECALVVISSSNLPLGGKPTTPSGQGIAPSSVGSPFAGVINTHGEMVGDYVELNRDSPGFSATIMLDDKMIIAAEEVKMTADWIDPDRKNWGIKYTYKGKEMDCSEGCEKTDIGGSFFKSKAAFTANFPC